MQTSKNKIEPHKEHNLNQPRPCNFNLEGLVDSKGRLIVPKDDAHYLQMMKDYADDFDYFLFLQRQYQDSRDKFYHFNSLMLRMHEIIKTEKRGNDQSKIQNISRKAHTGSQPVKNRVKGPLLSKRGFSQNPRFITKSKSRSKSGSRKFAVERRAIMKSGLAPRLQKHYLSKPRMNPSKKEILLKMDLCRLDDFESRIFGEGFRELPDACAPT